MIYLDNNATTKLAPEVVKAMLPFLETAFGNPSSAHSTGRSSREAVEDARAQVAQLLSAQPDEIFFTSGGTESDNWAIYGALESAPDKRHIVTSRVEHEAVRVYCEQLERRGIRLTWLDVDSDGSLDLDRLRDSVDHDTAIVSLMFANNETGVIFPIEQAARVIRHRSKAMIHVDGVNAVGKVPIDLSSGLIDLFSLSAHKMHGPKGIGALYINRRAEIPPLFVGGRQQSGRRAGTEAVHQIVGFGAAARVVSDFAAMDAVRELRDRLEGGIIDRIPNTGVNGAGSRLPNTTNISFENLNGEMILSKLDDAAICVSTGSACNSADHKTSAVLEAMDVPYSRAMGSIRFSLSRYNTSNEIDTVLQEAERVTSELRQLSEAHSAGS